MDLDLNSLLKSTGAFVDQSNNASAQMEQVLDRGNDVVEARTRAANEAAAAAGIKVQAEMGEIARQEASRQAIAARLGTDPSKPGWIIGKSAETIAIAQKGLAEADENIRTKESVNFMTNPLGWIAAQMTVKEDYANYNHFARMNNRAEDAAKTAEAMTHTAFQTSNALSATTTETYVSAMKILGAYQYNQQAGEAAMQGVRWNMEGIVAATNASRDRLQVLYSANSAVMQEKHYQTELARLRLSTAQFNLQAEALKDKKDEDSLITTYIRDGYFNMTGKIMDAVSTKNAVILYKAKQPDIVSMFESGLASSKVTGGEGTMPVISLSPAKAADLVGTGKVTNMSPAMKQIGEQLVTWRRAFENQAVQNAYPHDPKDKTSKEIAFNKYVEDQKQIALTSVGSDSVFAPYPIDKVAKLNSTVAVLPVWTNVLEPAAKTGVNINDPNIAFGVVVNAMREGKLTYNDALDLSLMYAAGLHLNNQTRNFIAFGISPVKSYNSPINVPGTFGKTNVNWVDQKTVATVLNKAEAINAQYRIQNAHKPLGIGQ